MCIRDSTTYGENTGVLALTRVFDPRVVRIAAGFAILLSFCPKFAAVISCMPACVIGGVSLVLYGMISAVGIRNLVENLSLIHISGDPGAQVAGGFFEMRIVAEVRPAVHGDVHGSLLCGGFNLFGESPKHSTTLAREQIDPRVRTA